MRERAFNCRKAFSGTLMSTFFMGILSDQSQIKISPQTAYPDACPDRNQRQRSRKLQH
jgi:hypothetical protein